jgi:hypothetical protein
VPANVTRMPKFAKPLQLLVVALLSQLSWCTIAAAQSTTEGLETVSEPTDESPKASERIIVPVPISDPQLGSGLGLGIAWFYSPDAGSKPWTTGIGAIKTSNGSWGVAGYQKMSLAEDSLRFEALGGVGKLNSHFYGVGDELDEQGRYADMSQEAFYLRMTAKFRIANHLFAGAKLTFIDQTIMLAPPAGQQDILNTAELNGKATILSVGPVITFDSTDASFAHTKGVLVNAEWLFASSLTDDDYGYRKANINANQYFGIGASSVLALRQSMCSASQDTRFFDLCLFGSNSNLRGYASGEYRDYANWAVQGEWRQHLFGKFGVVAFAGVGGTAENVRSLPSTKLLPSVGAGIRFLLAKENGVNLRLDFAHGRHSNGAYLSIGEAF